MKIASVNNNYNYNSPSQQKQPTFRAHLGDTFEAGLKGLYEWYGRAHGIDALETIVAKDKETTRVVKGFWPGQKKTVPRISFIDRLRALVVKAPDGITDIHPTLEIVYTPAVYAKGRLVSNGSYNLLAKMPKAQVAEATEVAKGTQVAEIVPEAEVVQTTAIAKVAEATEGTRVVEEAKEPTEKHEIFVIPENLLEDLYSYYRELVNRFQVSQDTEIALNAAVAKTMGKPAK